MGDTGDHGLRPGVVALLSVVVLSAVAATLAQSPPPGTAPEQLFRERCASCHLDDAPSASASPDHAAPPLSDLRARQIPEVVFRQIDIGGRMYPNARGWSRDDKRRVAEWITGKTIGALDDSAPMRGQCDAAPPPLVSPFSGPHWSGWSVDSGNGRFQSAESSRLTAADLLKLQLKWAFGLPGALAAVSQPTIAGGRVFVGSERGFVYALDAKSGCYFWSFQTEAGVRTAIVVGESKRDHNAVLYVGDLHANVYSLDAQTGRLLWRRKVDEHALARITGTPTLAGERIYVPVAAVGEEIQASDPDYECCTFRGSVVALDAETGRLVWKAYTIPEAPKRMGTNAKGTQLWAPAGGSIWSSPTVDLEGGVVYVGSGNGFTRPAAATTDSVLALDIKDGHIRWVQQLLAGDALGGGPDVDIGASPILRRLSRGKRVLIVGQKSGDVFGLDPDHAGERLWKVNLSKGGTNGGIEWGMAADDRVVYVPISDLPSSQRPVTKEAGLLTALRLDSGDRVWSVPGVIACTAPGCHPAKSAALTAIPDAVFAGSVDGYLRAYSTADGHVLWEIDTKQEFTTTNGIRAHGGSINGPGPAVADGLLVVNSGYSFFGLAGNVLLAFGVK